MSKRAGIPDYRLRVYGGRHRSVVVAEEIGRILTENGYAPRTPRPRIKNIEVEHQFATLCDPCGRHSAASLFPLESESSMTVRVGINGFGRIGRNFFRAAQNKVLILKSLR